MYLAQVEQRWLGWRWGPSSVVGSVAKWCLRSSLLLCLYSAVFSDSFILDLVPLMAAKWLQEFRVSHLGIEMFKGGHRPFWWGFLKRGNLSWKSLPHVLYLLHGPKVGQLLAPESVSGSGMGVPIDIDYVGPSSWRGNGLSLPKASGTMWRSSRNLTKQGHAKKAEGGDV